MLRRKMLSVLESWREANRSRAHNPRKAFMLKGARQTGKTYLVRHFGRLHYQDIVEVNFYEMDEAAGLIAQCRSGSEVISALSLLVGHEVSREDTLVFLDEVQEAPQVITQIKFLVEDGRFDVIASGSLLGIELKNVASFPVGYVELHTMYPLDFEEFCWSQGADEGVVARIRESYDSRAPLPDVLHERLVRLFRLYLIVGGMPEAVQRYLDTHYDLGAVRDVYGQIVSQYRIDITKYADKTRTLQVRAIFDGLPSQLAKENKRFQLKSLKDKAVFERFANDFQWLVDAGVAYKCNVVTEPIYPLKRTEEPRKFKLYESDTGLLLSQYPVGVSARVLEGARDVNYGAVYENAVAQALASQDVPLRYYHNSRKGEVDFLVERYDSGVLPIEVKSGKDYKRHGALNNLLGTQTCNIEEAFVLSEANVSRAEREGKPVWYLPIYLAFCIAEHAVKRGPDRQAAELLASFDASPPTFGDNDRTAD